VFHPDQDVRKINGEWMAEDQLDWILSKGDLVLSGRTHKVERKITVSFLKRTRGIKSFPIYRYTDPGPRPTRYRNAVDGKFYPDEIRYGC